MTNIFFTLGAILAVIFVSMGAFAAQAATKQRLGWMLRVVAA